MLQGNFCNLEEVSLYGSLGYRGESFSEWRFGTTLAAYPYHENATCGSVAIPSALLWSYDCLIPACQIIPE